MESRLIELSRYRFERAREDFHTFVSVRIFYGGFHAATHAG